MSLSLEGLRHLMRGNTALPDNMSETEVRHYASQVMRRLKRGENVETLEMYLRGIGISNVLYLPISSAAYDLARQVHVLFNTTG